MWKPPIGEQPDQSALYPGIPEWLGRTVRDWIGELLVYPGALSHDAVAIASEYDRLTRSNNPLTRAMTDLGLTSAVWARGDEFTLNFVDFLLFKLGKRRGWTDIASRLEIALDQGGSEWAVRETEAGARLEKRVDDTVHLAAVTTMQESGAAGKLLAEAWHALYGRSPDHEEAYEKAIKAVEEAAAPIVSAKNSIATLGSIVRDMKAQHGWDFPLGTGPDTARESTPVLMADALWRGQQSRHGGNGYRKPTPQEAEAAVTLAVALVHAFSNGLVSRRIPQTPH